MSESKPVWNIELVPLSSPDEVKQFEANRRHAEHMIISAFAVPAEFLRPHIGTIWSREQRAAVEEEITRLQVEIADAFLPFIRALDDSAAEMKRLAQVGEQLRLKMIGRRCQMVTAVALIAVYLLIEAIT